jgi:hypothetical protein
MLVSLLALGGQAFAELCTVDAVPAASLLVPYFEVDLAADAGAGVNTLFSINNASAAPTIAHVAVWSDWSQPVLDFDIFLTGFDVQTVDLYDVFVNGNLPVTADEQSDPLDDISPHGLNPEWDDSFDDDGGLFGARDCIDIFPFFINPILTGNRIDVIQAKLTGQPDDEGACFGANYDDADGTLNSVARGYITVDNADRCSLIFPNDLGYFTDGQSLAVANNNNILWGDTFYVNPAEDFASGDNLVHIEATDNPDWPTGYTFYSRYTVFDGFLDGREPLGTSWGVRYLNGGDFDGGTALTAWRDSTVNDIRDGGFTCGPAGVLGVGPAWHPMNETEVVAFNERESAVELCAPFSGPDGPPVSPPEDPENFDPVCFPLETQRVQVGEGNLATPFNFGWLFLNLNVGIDTVVGPDDYDPGTNGTLAQSYVSATHSALGRFSVGLGAIELTSACDDLDPTLTDVWDIPTN